MCQYADEHRCRSQQPSRNFPSQCDRMRRHHSCLFPHRGDLHNTVFSGFSANALNDRLVAFRPKGGHHGRSLRSPWQADSLEGKSRRVHRWTGRLQSQLLSAAQRNLLRCCRGRDFWWRELMHSASNHCPPEPMEANEPGLVFYTSGTTGKPKGVVHSGAGFIINNTSMRNSRWIIVRDVLWCTADIGVAHDAHLGDSGCANHRRDDHICRGRSRSSEADRFFRIVHEYRVNKVFTSPSGSEC